MTAGPQTDIVKVLAVQKGREGGKENNTLFLVMK